MDYVPVVYIIHEITLFDLADRIILLRSLLQRIGGLFWAK